MNIIKKTAQVGIFVVIGVILVIGFVFLLSLNFENVPIFSDEKSTYSVKEYVENCIETETNYAIERVGTSGGWLYSRPMLYTDDKSPSQVNKLAQGFNFLGVNKMPYWFYYDDQNEIFELNIPNYDDDNDQFSIKNQIERYLEENIENNCFRGFRDFKDLYNIKYQKDEVDVEIELNEREIIVDLLLEIEISEVNSETVESIFNFRNKVENKIYLPYNLAKEITLAQANNSFLDTSIMNILNSYQTTDNRDLLPPTSQITLDYDFEPWRVQQITETSKIILSSEISRIQFLNTDFTLPKIPESLEENEFVIGSTKIYAKDYISQTSKLDENNPKLFNRFKELKVIPTFEPFFPMYLNIKQALGNHILFPQPEMFAGFLPIYYTNYKATYEISAPVVLEIKTSNINDNFVFNLPIETNIKNNKALKNNLNFNINLEDFPKPKKSLTCDNSQFISKPIRINITDPIYNGDRSLRSPDKGINDAIVEFTCKKLTTCYVGKTKEIQDETTPEEYRTTTTLLNFRLPTNCDPGTLKISKFGHRTLIFENLNPNEENEIDLGNQQMSSGKKINISIGIKDPRLSSSGVSKSLKEHNSGFLMFEHLEEENLISFVELNSENQRNQEIKLYPGKYKITGIITHNEPFTIPEKKICYKDGVFSGKKCETMPQIDMDAWISGRINIEEFEITTEQLIKYNSISVVFTEFETPSNYDELTELAVVSEAIPYKPQLFNKR